MYICEVASVPQQSTRTQTNMASRREPKMNTDEAREMLERLNEEDRRRRRDEGSDSSDNDLLFDHASDPSEPALRNSVFESDTVSMTTST